MNTGRELYSLEEFFEIEIPSIEEYVLVGQKPAHVVIHRRAQQWKPQVLESLDSSLDLQSVGLLLPAARIYKGVSAEILS